MAKINYKALVILGVASVGYFMFGGGDGSSSPGSSSVVNSFKSVYDNGPPDERSFISIIINAKSASEKAANDMQVGGIKSSRDSSVCDVLKDKKINQWQAVVDEITSNSDGKGVISLKVSENITIKTWNNSFSDIGDKTLIEPGTPLFSAASGLTPGGVVTFSGSFIGDGDNCIRESSMSLRGKVEDPAFIFKFTNIQSL